MRLCGNCGLAHPSMQQCVIAKRLATTAAARDAQSMVTAMVTSPEVVTPMVTGLVTPMVTQPCAECSKLRAEIARLHAQLVRPSDGTTAKRDRAEYMRTYRERKAGH